MPSLPALRRAPQSPSSPRVPTCWRKWGNVRPRVRPANPLRQPRPRPADCRPVGAQHLRHHRAGSRPSRPQHPAHHARPGDTSSAWSSRPAPVIFKPGFGSAKPRFNPRLAHLHPLGRLPLRDLLLPHQLQPVQPVPFLLAHLDPFFSHPPMLRSEGLSRGTFYLAQIGTSHVAATPSSRSLDTAGWRGVDLPCTGRRMEILESVARSKIGAGFPSTPPHR